MIKQSFRNLIKILSYIKIFLLLGIIFFVSSVIYFAVMTVIVTSSLPDDGLDVLVVLGAGLYGDRVSPVLAERLEVAYTYAVSNENTVIIVSGGQGDNELVSEALAMRRYLVLKGLPEDRIIMEDKSTSTEENFRFSKIILDELFDGEEWSAGFATSGFHCYRARQLALSAGFRPSAALPAKTPVTVLPTLVIREYLAILWVFRSVVFIYIGLAAFVNVLLCRISRKKE